MPLEMLKYSPFSDFLIPGIVLLSVAEIALTLGAFLVAWIIIHVYWIHDFHWLHALYLSLGIKDLILGYLLRNALHLSR
jgi:hypothetical protein